MQFVRLYSAAMEYSALFNMASVAALVPVSFLWLRKPASRDSAFWLLLAVAALLPCARAWTILQGEWNASFGAALWVGVAASMAVFFVISWVDRQAWRLTPLVVPYLALMALFAAILPPTGVFETPEGGSSAWIGLHIVVSVAALALLTPAAMASLSSLLQSRALKRKRPTSLTRALPPLADSDRLSDRLLIASEAVLLLGLVSGLAIERLQTGSMFQFSHKVLFSFIAFAVIGVLLIGRRVCGVRGQMAARVALLAYLLVIAGYFGMKFVHQVLLG